jgi:hypothetical protein
MDRHDLEAAGARNKHLRGLLAIPLGLLCVLAALGNWEVGPLTHPWVFLVAVGAIGLLFLPIAHFYDDNYGRVTPSANQQLRLGALTAVGFVVILGGSTLMRSNASWSLDLPVNATAVCFAIVMLLSYTLTVGLQPHHVLVWGAVLAAGAAPLWNGADPSNIGLVMVAAAVMACGILDHRLFVQTFGPRSALDHDGDDAGP